MQTSQLIAEFKGKKGNYIKSFLINGTINKNLWQSKHEDPKEWIGKPGVLYVKNGEMVHPESETKEKALTEQEEYRVSTIIHAGVDSRTNNLYVIEEVHDDDTFEKIKSGEIRFHSPSVWPDKSVKTGFVENVKDSTPLHHAFVSVPAYGEQAKITGTCTDTKKECKHALAPLVASTVANTIDSRSEFVRTIPFTSFNPDVSKKQSIMETTSTKEKEELTALKAELDESKKTVDSLNAEIEDLKESKKGKSKNATDGLDDKSKPKDANNDDSDETSKKANEELKKELQDVKAKNASLTKFATEGLVNSMIELASSNGTQEKQLVAMRKEFEGMDIDSLQKTKALIASFNPNMSTTDIPDPTKALSASVDDKMSDDDLLMGLYS